MKILIVDDVASERNSLRKHLEGLGHEVVEATDGLSALRVLFNHNHNLDPSIKCIITDMQMPKMTGLGLLQATWRNGTSLQILLRSSEPTYREYGEDIELKEVEVVFDPNVMFRVKTTNYTEVGEFLKWLR